MANSEKRVIAMDLPDEDAASVVARHLVKNGARHVVVTDENGCVVGTTEGTGLPQDRSPPSGGAK